MHNKLRASWVMDADFPAVKRSGDFCTWWREWQRRRGCSEVKGNEPLASAVELPGMSRCHAKAFLRIPRPVFRGGPCEAPRPPIPRRSPRAPPGLPRSAPTPPPAATSPKSTSCRRGTHAAAGADRAAAEPRRQRDDPALHLERGLASLHFTAPVSVATCLLTQKTRYCLMPNSLVTSRDSSPTHEAQLLQFLP